MPQPQVKAQYFRLPINVATPFVGVNDLLSSSAVKIATGSTLEFDFCFSDGVFADNNVLDLSNFASVEFRIQAPGSPHSAQVFVTASVPAASFLPCTAAQFIADTNQQVTVTIPGAQNVLQPTTGSQGNYWLVVYGISTDGAADPIVFCCFQISVLDSGIPLTNPALPQSFKIGTKMPFVCSDGKTRDVTIQATGNGRWSLNINQVGYNGPGQATYSIYCADGNWRDLTVIQVQGSWTIDTGQAGHA